MELTGEYRIPAPKQQVWNALVDPQVLKVCIPGCEDLEKVSETEFAARVTAKVGAIKARFKGNVELSDIDAPNGYTLSGKGQGGVAGFAKGSARVTLEDDGDGATILRYVANADIGGKLAAVGSRVIAGVAKKTADDFFGAFAAQLGGAPPAAAEAAQAPAAQVKPVAVPPKASAPAPAAARSFAGTGRDLLWFALGILVGAGFVWAAMT